MRHKLLSLGLLFTTLLGGGIWLGVWKFDQLVDSGQSARGFVDSAVPAITAHWDPAALTQRADPALLASTDAGQLKVLFVQLSALGPLLDYRGAALEGTSFESQSQRGSISTARYLARATYTHGDASIDVTLVQRGSGWRIAGFHVVSAALPAPERGESL